MNTYPRVHEVRQTHHPAAMCKALVRFAAHQPPGHQRERFLQLSRVMLGVVANSRDAACAMEEAKAAADRSEMAALKMKEQLVEMRRLVGGSRVGTHGCGNESGGCLDRSGNFAATNTLGNRDPMGFLESQFQPKVMVADGKVTLEWNLVKSPVAGILDDRMEYADLDASGMAFDRTETVLDLVRLL